MSTFQYACPHCTRNNVIDAGNVGDIVRCLHCKRDVAWDGETPIPAPHVPSSPARKKIRWKAVGWGVFFLFVTLPLLGQGCWEVFQAWRSASWPSADGVVTSSTFKHPDRDDRPGGNTSAAKIRYSYQVDGVTYQNDTVRFGQVFTNRTFGIASATVQRHPPGPARVYYDAQNPGTSVLEPGLHTGLLVKTGAGLLLTIVACAFLRNALRRR